MTESQLSPVSFPVRITLRGVERSDELEQKILQHADKLSRFEDQIQRCLVTVECPRPSERGRRYHVRIELRLPGPDLIVRGDEQDACDKIEPALHDAFETAERRLDRREERARDRRHG